MAVPENEARRKSKEHERYLNQREIINARSIAWRKANRERNLITRRAWLARNRVSENRRSRVFKLAHPDSTKAILARWRKANPDKKREHDHRRRALLAGCIVSDFTAAQWRALIEQYGNRCAYCGKKHDKLQQDHVLALARGGNHTMSNIVPACKPCNAKKKDRTLDEAGMKFRVLVRL